MGILLGFVIDFLVLTVLGTIMSLLTETNYWYGLPILALMIIATAFSGYIISHKSKKRKVFNTFIVSLFFYLTYSSIYNSGDINLTYLDNIYAVQLIPVSLLGALINYIVQKKRL